MTEHILGIETSCDETSAAVLTTDQPPRLRSLSILSQDVHRIFGGVVPELASRAHLTALPAVTRDALRQAEIEPQDIDGIAVTSGPGLIGALLVGVMYAKGLALRLERPLVGVNHLEGHLFAATLEHPTLSPPFLALLVSGGHTMLVLVEAWGRYRLLGQTLDDAAGEAFDKVASLLGLDYPGGPPLERLAQDGDPTRFAFPRPLIREGMDFSFSGLKTAVLYAVRQRPPRPRERADLAASFQAAVIDVLIAKIERGLDAVGCSTVVLSGGVACNQALVAAASTRLSAQATVLSASPRLNADNAGMIARAGWFHLAHARTSGMDLDPRANLPIPGLYQPSDVREA